MDEIVEINSDTSSDEYTDDFSESFIISQDNNNGSLVKCEQSVLSTQQVYEMMEGEVKKVALVTSIPMNRARSLLSDYKWNSEKLLDVVFGGGDASRKMMEKEWTSAPVDITKPQEPGTCGICFDIITDPEKNLELECNERFCVDCITNYLVTTITSSGGLISTAIICPGFKCLLELEDQFVFKMLEDSSLKSKYQQFIADTYVQGNRLMKWCPNAACQNAILLESYSLPQLYESVRCSCGFWFCFICQKISHDPVSCEMLIKWATVKAEDLEAQKWILMNTKQCAKCLANIEKNGGCMHMSCSKCRYEFCWVCMKPWTQSHNCPRNETIRPSERSDLKYVRRFIGYSSKHDIMKQSYDLDKEKYKTKMAPGTKLELEEQWIKIDFVSQAVENLLQCRRILMHSYVFSYFMTTIDNQMYIFEENLTYLEQSTENLSHILEHEVTANSVSMLKEKIIDASGLCHKRQRCLMDHIIEGHNKNWWRDFPIPPEELIAVDEDAVQRLLY